MPEETRNAARPPDRHRKRPLCGREYLRKVYVLMKLAGGYRPIR